MKPHPLTGIHAMTGRPLRRNSSHWCHRPLLAGSGPRATSIESVRNAVAVDVELEAIGSFQSPFPTPVGAAPFLCGLGDLYLRGSRSVSAALRNLRSPRITYST